MKVTIIGLLSAALTCTMAFGQSFEGKLTFKVEFDIKTQKIGGLQITKEQVIEKMKKDGEYFDAISITLKEGNYIKEDNSSSERRIIYKSDLNKIYTFQKDFEYVIITDANKYNSKNLELKEPEFEKIDSVKIINGNTCKLIRLSWGKLGEEYYFYNVEAARLDPGLFTKHNYEYFNRIVEMTNSYPLEIIKTLNNFISVKMTLVGIKEEKIDESLFEIPALEKAEKDYYEMMLQMTGSEVMKLKN